MGNVLETLYTEHLSRHFQLETDTGWNTHSFDLAAYTGQTIRVHFQELIPDTYAGPAMIEFDDLSLIVGIPGGE